MSSSSENKTSRLIVEALSKAHSSNASERSRGSNELKNILSTADVVIPGEHIEDLLRVLTELLYDDNNDISANCVSGLGHLVANEAFPSESEDIIIDILCNLSESRPGVSSAKIMASLDKIGRKPSLATKKIEALYGTFLNFASHQDPRIRLHAVAYVGKLCARNDMSHKSLDVLDLLMSIATGDEDEEVRHSSICSLGAYSLVNIIPDSRLDSILEFFLLDTDKGKRLYALGTLVDGAKSYFPTRYISRVYQHARVEFALNHEKKVREDALTVIYRVAILKDFPADQLLDVSLLMLSVNKLNEFRELRHTALVALTKLSKNDRVPHSLHNDLLSLGLEKMQSKTESTRAGGLHLVCHLIARRSISSQRASAVLRVLRMLDDQKISENLKLWVMSAYADLSSSDILQKPEHKDWLLIKQIRAIEDITIPYKTKLYAIRGLGNMCEHSIETLKRHPEYIEKVVIQFEKCLEIEVDADPQDEDVKAASVWGMGELIKHDLVPHAVLNVLTLRLFMTHVGSVSTNIGISALWAITQWGESKHFPVESLVKTVRSLAQLYDTKSLKYRAIDCTAAIVKNYNLKELDANLAAEVSTAIREKYDAKEQYFAGNDRKPLPEKRQREVTKSMEAVLAALA